MRALVWTRVSKKCESKWSSISEHWFSRINLVYQVNFVRVQLCWGVFLEFHQWKFFKYSFLLAVLPRNGLGQIWLFYYCYSVNVVNHNVLKFPPNLSRFCWNSRKLPLLGSFYNHEDLAYALRQLFRVVVSPVDDNWLQNTHIYICHLISYLF